MKNFIFITSGENPSAELSKMLEKYGRLTCLGPDADLPTTAPDAILVDVDVLSGNSSLPTAVESAVRSGVPIVIVGPVPQDNDAAIALSKSAYAVISDPLLPENIEHVMASLPDQAPMAAIVKGALNATIYVLETIVGSSVSQTHNVDYPTSKDHGYSGSIPLSGDVDGTLTLLLPDGLAKQTAAAILSCDPSELEVSWISDGVGEITNQIAGRLRTMLSREGKDIVITIPELAKTEPWYGAQKSTEQSYHFECCEFPCILRLSLRAKAKESLSI